MGIKGRVDKMVVLACEDCKERNYTTVKNKKTSIKNKNLIDVFLIMIDFFLRE